MSKAPLPAFDHNAPILRGHVVDAASQAYKSKEFAIWGELWTKVLKGTGIHPLEAVPLELWRGLSPDAMLWVIENANCERVNDSIDERRKRAK